MGLYINIGNDGFRAARNGEYIDKSDLIELVNGSLNSERQFMCVSRARRFGKSMAACFGFTDEEVSDLCCRNKIDKEQIKLWYDGYRIGEQKSIYNPLSVIRAIRRRYCESYWSNTGTYETVSHYIKMNFEGLKDDVIRLLAGERCSVNTKNFQNDLNVINSKNDIFTVLIHLGYLSYNRDTNECAIPNKEIGLEFENAVEDTGWNVISDALKQSEQLLQWTIAGEAERVADAIDRIHSDNTSILQYNDENSLACVLALAYYAAKSKYAIIRELPAGKGFADLVLVPRREVDMPAIVLELKYNRSVKTAIDQIKDNRYTDTLLDYVGDVVLVGVNYDKRTKRHQCSIERVAKEAGALGENVTENVTENVAENRRQSIIQLIRKNVTISTSELAERLGVTRMTIHRDIEKLKQQGHLTRIGPDKGGWWKVEEN